MKSGFKMKGMDFGNSPTKVDLTKKTVLGPRAPIKQKQVPLSEHEKKKGTMITGGSNAEVINDLEDRIEFLQNDIKDEGQDGPTKTRAQLAKLQAQLKKLRA